MKYIGIIAVIIAVISMSGCSKEEITKSPEKMLEENVEQIKENAKEEAEVVASEVGDETSLEKGLEDYYAVEHINYISTDKEMILQGEFSKTDTSAKDKIEGTGRILQLEKLDIDFETVEEYTLTMPRLTIKAEKTILKGGKFVGDIYVNAAQFTLDNTKVIGNIFFTKDEFKESFDMKNGATISENMEVL